MECIIISMRRLACTFMLLLALTGLYSAVYPQDRSIGQISAAEEGSPEALLLGAFREEYSLDWLDEYVSGEVTQSFSLFYSDTLLSLLPLANPIISVHEEGRVNIKDTVSGALVTVYTDEELKITALGIR